MKKVIIGLVLGMLIGSATTALAATGEVTALFAQFALKINGQDKHIDTTPLVYNGTSYLPVREMANLVGYDVTYKADSRTIELNTPPTEGVAKPMETTAAADWVWIKDLAQKQGVKIAQTEQSNRLFQVLKGDTLYFEFDANLLKDDTGEVITVAGNNGSLIHLKSKDGFTWVNRSDLEQIGLIL